MMGSSWFGKSTVITMCVTLCREKSDNLESACNCLDEGRQGPELGKHGGGGVGNLVHFSRI